MNLNATFIVQMAVFFALAWFTMTYVWPPVMRALDERAKKIADGLAAAERGRQDLMTAEARSRDIEREARERANEIIAAAERRAQGMIEEAKTAAKVEGDRLVTAAKAEVEQEAQRARDELRRHVAALAVSGAEKILRREVDQRAHTQMLEALEQEL